MGMRARQGARLRRGDENEVGSKMGSRTRIHGINLHTKHVDIIVRHLDVSEHNG